MRSYLDLTCLKFPETGPARGRPRLHRKSWAPGPGPAPALPEIFGDFTENFRSAYRKFPVSRPEISGEPPEISGESGAGPGPGAQDFR